MARHAKIPEAHSPRKKRSEPNAAEVATKPPRRVLLIEDHADTLEKLAVWLIEHGFEVEEYDNLGQAMQSLNDRSCSSLH